MLHPAPTSSYFIHDLQEIVAGVGDVSPTGLTYKGYFDLMQKTSSSIKLDLAETVMNPVNQSVHSGQVDSRWKLALKSNLDTNHENLCDNHKSRCTSTWITTGHSHQLKSRQMLLSDRSSSQTRRMQLRLPLHAVATIAVSVARQLFC